MITVIILVSLSSSFLPRFFSSLLTLCYLLQSATFSNSSQSTLSKPQIWLCLSLPDTLQRLSFVFNIKFSCFNLTHKNLDVYLFGFTAHSFIILNFMHPSYTGPPHLRATVTNLLSASSTFNHSPDSLPVFTETAFPSLCYFFLCKISPESTI